jgi:hypothetical protein
MTSDSKVKRFLIISICNTFDELMLHHDICSISFSEASRKVLNAWRTKYVDWRSNPSPSQVYPQGHHITFHQGKKEIKSSMF